LAEGVGNAPTSACADPVFETGAASFYLPAFLRSPLSYSFTPALNLNPFYDRPNGKGG